MSSTTISIAVGLTLVFAFWFWRGYEFGSDLAAGADRDAARIITPDDRAQ